MVRAPLLAGVPEKDLKLEQQSLQKFKDRVDAILQELEGSAASKAKIADQLIARGSFGGNFTEAEALCTQYNGVHARLTGLSQILADRIEQTGIAVQCAKQGFQNIDEDILRRFYTIQSQAQQRFQDQQQLEHAEQQAEQKRLDSQPPLPLPSTNGQPTTTTTGDQPSVLPLPPTDQGPVVPLPGSGQQTEGY